jgi:hypothetical protein
MVVFLSWSGNKSKHVASALNQWLPLLINTIEPWLSSENIEPGARWSPEIAAKLEAANTGIICVTQSNAAEPWLVFEAGALSKVAGASRVAVLSIDIKQADITGPLSQFQGIALCKDDLFKLVCMINRSGNGSLIPQEQLARAYEVLWPTLATALETLPDETKKKHAQRGEAELLDEILALVRNQDARLREFEKRHLSQMETTFQLMRHETEFRNLLSHRLNWTLRDTEAGVDREIGHPKYLEDEQNRKVLRILKGMYPEISFTTKTSKEGVEVNYETWEKIGRFIIPPDVVSEIDIRDAVATLLKI